MTTRSRSGCCTRPSGTATTRGSEPHSTGSRPSIRASRVVAECYVEHHELRSVRVGADADAAPRQGARAHRTRSATRSPPSTSPWPSIFRSTSPRTRPASGGCSASAPAPRSSSRPDRGDAEIRLTSGAGVNAIAIAEFAVARLLQHWKRFRAIRRAAGRARLGQPVRPPARGRDRWTDRTRQHQRRGRGAPPGVRRPRARDASVRDPGRHRARRRRPLPHHRPARDARRVRRRDLRGARDVGDRTGSWTAPRSRR